MDELERIQRLVPDEQHEVRQGRVKTLYFLSWFARHEEALWVRALAAIGTYPGSYLQFPKSSTLLFLIAGSPDEYPLSRRLWLLWNLARYTRDGVAIELTDPVVFQDPGSPQPVLVPLWVVQLTRDAMLGRLPDLAAYSRVPSLHAELVSEAPAARAGAQGEEEPLVVWVPTLTETGLVALCEATKPYGWTDLAQDALLMRMAAPE